MDNSKNGGARKPEKPYPEYPLFAHNNGYWARKIRAKFSYFGKWSEVSWQEALSEYLRQKDDLYAGKVPRKSDKVVTVGRLCNAYLNAKLHLLDTKEIGPRRFADCKKACERIATAFGETRAADDLLPADWAKLRAQLAKTLGMLSLSIEIQRIRGVFIFGVDERLIEQPTYGTQFGKPNKRAIRAEARQRGSKMLSQAEVQSIVIGAPQPFVTMALLGLNAGLGNHDIAQLRTKNLDMQRGWLDFPRPKTEIERRCPLWPETVKSLQDWFSVRPPVKPSLVFVTWHGNPWVYRSDGEKGAWVDSISREFRKLFDLYRIRRPGVNFYSFRRVLETVGGDTADQVATDYLMGHAPAADDMGAVYRQEVFAERLRKVTDAVRAWVFGDSWQPSGSGKTC